MKYLTCLLFLLWINISYGQQPKLILPIGHTSTVNSMHFSPDGKKIITTSWDKTAKIWDAQTGKLLADLTGQLYSAIFSPDGKKIATASADKTAKIWDVENGKLLVDLVGHSNGVHSASFSPDGKKIATASRDKTAKIWDAQTGKLLVDLIGHTSGISSAQFSPDGKKIVTASWDNTAKIWDAQTGKLLADLSKHSKGVYLGNFSPDGKKIVTVSNDSTAKIWDSESGKLLADLSSHLSWVNSAIFNPDGNKIVTSSDDHSAKIWDAVTGNLLADLVGHYNEVNSAIFSPDGKKIITASSDKISKIWDAVTGKLLSNIAGHSKGVKSAIFSPDGKKIATASWDHTSKIWDAETGKLLSDLVGHSNGVHSAIFSLDGKKIVTASNNSTAKIWDTKSGKLLANLTGHSDWVYSATFSTDGKKILTASSDNTAKIWDAQSGKILADLAGHTGQVNTAAFSPDGKKIVTASWDSTAKIWDAQSGKLLADLARHSTVVISAKFSPDGKTIVTACGDNTAKIWDAQIGKIITNLSGHSDWVYSATFSPDGKKIVTASCDNTARIWDANTGKLLVVLMGHSSSVNSAIFSSDGNKILSAGDNTAKIWDAETGKLMADLSGHFSWVNSANFSPDGKKIVTASLDNTSKIWDAKTGELIYTFIAIDSTDYLIYDKEFLYDGTEATRKLLYYTCGDEIIELDQLKDLCWEPDLVSKINGINPEPITAKKLSEIDICNFTPKVEDEGFEEGNYQYKIIPRKGGLGQVQLYVNDKLINTFDSSQLLKKGGNYFLTVTQKEVAPYFLSDTENKVMVKAKTRAGTMSSRGSQIINYEKKKSLENPNVYIVSIGISDYKGDKLKLKYASKDAVDFASTLKAASKKLLNNDRKEHVSTFVFHTEKGSNRWPNKLTIQKLMDSIAQISKADDILIIFFGGHGVLVSGEKKNLYLLTAEASAFDLSGVEKEVAISTNELNEWMRNIKANKQLLILDACNSGQMVKELFASRDIPADQTRAIEDLKDKTGTYVLSASASGQSAYETSLYDHGLLTQSLLSSIKLGNGLKDDKYIDVTKWFNTASDEVKILAKDIGGRQDPQILGNASFQVGIADEEVREGIKLSIRKKIFRGSTIVKEGKMPKDIAGLTVLVDKELNEVSARGGNSPFTFVPDNTFTESYSIIGSYTLNGNILTITIYLMKGEQEESIYQFEMKGELDKKEDLAKMIVEKVNAFLGK